MLYNSIRLLDNMPLLPWLYLTRADTLGVLSLGLGIGSVLVLLGYTVFADVVKQGGRLLLRVRWKQMLQDISSRLEGHLPQVSRLFQSRKVQEWREEYMRGKEALQLAETFQKQTKQRKQQPDFY